ncbi:7-carboxy-7-deazaguanine synthase [Peptoniphilus asaccharolyticus DSM 20463]|uniref:7-carboxy-7-deazaguanine synthase n=1 Tax=Peptoniphilus asaccharolyticus DSM 20463 TaxID=573058 RepID=A0A1W1UK14_PEPAS|nr:radical SAM protein [Peptoniphilus asaccharolyticus]MBL7574839.1 radical SAM protein [Peptoniphilus asaccharolyticus]SMB81436.1 7-carboxy-7-deazaguanine synthase [Peptoniphilus asaccharolyticus DSM 20463]
MKYDINEIFYSIDGEGPNSGKLSVFIRLNYCNLRCVYCDTGYALGRKDNFYTLEEIVEQVESYGIKSVTITGGEPLEHDLKPLISRLLSLEYEIDIETNGSLDIRKYLLENVNIILDIKTPSSKMEKFNLYENLSKLRPNDVVKFVASENDMDFVLNIIQKYYTSAKIFISPIYGCNIDKIVEYIKEHRLEVRLQLQIHKYIWDPNMKGV